MQHEQPGQRMPPECLPLTVQRHTPRQRGHGLPCQHLQQRVGAAAHRPGWRRGRGQERMVRWLERVVMRTPGQIHQQVVVGPNEHQYPRCRRSGQALQPCVIELRQRPVTVQHPQRRESAPRRPGPRNADAHAPAAAVTVTDLERFEAVERRARIEYRTAKPCRWPTTARPRSGDSVSMRPHALRLESCKERRACNAARHAASTGVAPVWSRIRKVRLRLVCSTRSRQAWSHRRCSTQRGKVKRHAGLAANQTGPPAPGLFNASADKPDRTVDATSAHHRLALSIFRP